MQVCKKVVHEQLSDLKDKEEPISSIQVNYEHYCCKTVFNNWKKADCCVFELNVSTYAKIIGIRNC